jgi:hypothetical protein
MTPSTGEERTRATGTIEVKVYEPTPYDQPAEDPALARIHVEEDFSGDIAGSGVATFLQTSDAVDDASFVGVERVTGSIGAHSGTLVLQDQGTVKGSTVSGSWFVVPGSGTLCCVDFAAKEASPPNSANGPTSRSTTGSSEASIYRDQARSTFTKKSATRSP